MTEALAATVVDAGATGSGPNPFRTDLLPDVGDIVGVHYRLVRLLGKGMFGKVYVAERVDVPAHQVALKLVPREVYSGRNVERELVMLAAASHPNIVQLKDHGMTEGYVWLTMPVYEGVTLADRLHRSPLLLEQAYEVFLPIARALDALHKAGLRHQDIKPENIFLATFAGRLHPILLDLGVAAELSAPFVAGTMLYASPEQLSALSTSAESLQLTEKMDTYCLAATLLVSIVGPENFPGEGAESRLDIVRAQEIRARQPLAFSALPEVSGAIREKMNDAFGRWMHPDPALRPPVNVMADELDLLLEPEREVQRSLVRRQLRQKIVRRATFVTIIVLAGLAGLFAYSKRKTLRLASELAAARAEGAASFDKLDTCVSSYQLAQQETQTCRESKAKDQADFKASLDRIAKTGGSNEAAMSRHMQGLEATYTARIRACEDEAGNAVRQREQERERMSIDWQRRQAELTGERDEQSRVAELRAGELERCRAEFESQARVLQSERAATAARAAIVPAAAPIVPPSGGAPPAGGSTAPPASPLPPLPTGPE
jgi:serine/threonine protein kinase